MDGFEKTFEAFNINNLEKLYCSMISDYCDAIVSTKINERQISQEREGTRSRYRHSHHGIGER